MHNCSCCEHFLFLLPNKNHVIMDIIEFKKSLESVFGQKTVHISDYIEQTTQEKCEMLIVRGKERSGILDGICVTPSIGASQSLELNTYHF